MGDWAADWANDPYDDYNLTLEISYNYDYLAAIKQNVNGPILVWYPHKEMHIIPVDWLLKLLLDASKEPVFLREGKRIHVEGWNAEWTNDPDDDYNLVREILYNDLYVAVVKQTSNGLTLTWYPQTEMVTVPAEWLSNLLLKAQTELTNLPSDS